MKRLYLVRHGEVEGCAGLAMGHLDLPLSRAGAGQIEALAGSWHGPTPDRFFTSDLRRAVESARLLAARTGGEIVEDPRLRELSFGEWEGLSWDEIHRRDSRRLAAWGEDWWEVAPPGGETFAGLSRRVLSWFHELRDGETVVAVSHSGCIRAFLTALLGLPRSDVFDFALDHAHVSAVTGEGGTASLLYRNLSRFPEP